MPETFKQIADKLTSSSSVLIVLAPLPSPDSVASGLALKKYLLKMDKDVIVIAAGGSLNPRVDFLPGYNEIARELNIAKGFVIEVGTKRTPISELSYKKEDDKLSIFLKPKSGEFTKDDVTFKSSKFPYDAVVTLGVGSLEGLSQFYSRYAELFFETPIINIDYRGSNEGFGQYNLILVTAASLSEIVFDLIYEMEKDLIDNDVATSLLAGIIAETNSFQTTRTTPQSFLKASQLVNLGANQQDIVTRLYKNKSMGFLKLWGRVLARIKSEPESFLVYSAINRIDIEKSDASTEDVANILKEMVTQLGFAKIQVFMRELDPESTEVYINAPESLHLPDAFVAFQPESLQAHSLKFNIPTGLIPAEEQVLNIIRAEAKKLS